MPDVLVLDCHTTHSLAAIRALGRRGLTTTVASHRAWNPGRLSRHAGTFLRLPDPAVAQAAYLDAVEAELQARTYDVVVPVTESTVDLVVRNRDRVEPHAALPFPPYETLEVGLDKGQTIEAARALDVAHPRTMTATEVDLDAVGDELGFPVVVKPHYGSGREGVATAASPTELEPLYERTVAAHGPTLVQEYVPDGGERGVYTIYDREGTLAGVTVQERLRSRHPDGGASTLRETVVDPDLIRRADRLLAGLGWFGVAMVEFRIDPRDGAAKLLELNPRFWGSLPLSIAAGVDFPGLLYRLGIGEPLDRDLSYTAGVRARCLFADLLQVFEREDVLRALCKYVVPSRTRTHHDVVRLSDPLPTVGKLALLGADLRAAVTERVGAAG
ncbi:hypothetical protein L593_06865 [Salinarchaeum sp. Harcht-Bsk1]|uniref:carboxylate--amine ligase n=1 Tax=Salinarchaeum sp. Harcht-Bsk1 TaxID=1333523 RepID=UPI0003423AA1|nr:ATP-grasp domain-containing protein [Salinarchaeum sp. Harcht-Bsk1]AGN01320.1 hypothetical protein L593_06865 [Salinarchaeum sp. Harcht-Bsk1]